MSELQVKLCLDDENSNWFDVEAIDFDGERVTFIDGIGESIEIDYYYEPLRFKPSVRTPDHKVVLDWLKAYGDKNGGSNPIPTIWYLFQLLANNGCGQRVTNSFLKLDRKQQAEVLQDFSEWVKEQ